MKYAVITALSGRPQTTLYDPINGGYDDVDYFAFVDKFYHLNKRKQMLLPDFSTDPTYAHRRNAKMPKVLSWMMIPGYDYYIWHDSSSEFGLFKHPERDCAYEEAAVILNRGIDTDENIHKTVLFLQNQEWPINGGLFELSSFVYKNTPAVRNATLTWWELIQRYSSRDQVTFPYCLKKHNVSYSILPGSALGYGGNNNLIPSYV